MIINRSRVEAFQDCKRKYFYTYVMNLQKGRTSIALRIGLAAHRFWEHWYSMLDEPTDVRMSKALDAMREELALERPQQMIDLDRDNEMKIEAEVEGLCRAYVKRWGTSESFAVLEAEVKGDAPLGHGHIVRFRTDGLIEETNQIWVLENKTTNQLGPSFFDSYYFNHQCIIYVYGSAVITRMKISGVKLNAARKVNPRAKVSYPEFERQDIIVTRDHIENAIKTFTSVADDIVSRDTANIDEWPQNTKRCHDYGKCPFWEVCALGATAEVGPLYIQRRSDYVDDEKAPDLSPAL